MLIGYARVSTFEQNLDLQIDALKNYGCTEVFEEHVSGVISDRVQLEAAISYMRQGDTLVVWKLDRLGRTLKKLIQFVNDLKDKGIHFISLKENIDTTSATGTLIFHIFGALSEFERDVIIERTKAGLAAARARGRIGGRKKKLTPAQFKQVKELYESKKVPVMDICKTFNIAKPTLYKYLKQEHVLKTGDKKD